MDNKVKPAVIGGVVLGLLSVIPFVNWANACCCLWAIVGGLIGTYLYVKNSPTPASAGDGAIVGAIAGVVGAIISLVIGIPINLLMGNVMAGLISGIFEKNMTPEQAEMMRERMLAGQTVTGAIVNGLIAAVCLFIFAILGGLVGIPLFEKRKGTLPPPPPPSPSPGPVGY